MNPRKRKLVKSGKMQEIIDQHKNKTAVTQKSPVESEDEVTKNITSDSVTIKDVDKKTSKTKKKSGPMDSFIAKELEEIDRIPSSDKKTTIKKKTTTKKKAVARKKTTTKKKTGGK
ncbi:MAG TPA: hypothetical protein DF712_07370 [Balneola sp.]|nr:hypothetical protein [Balneola sp.]|tara:strand:- start:356 stop:703 length:348 start_codon:yes stop_codon:yes gene_type:complete